MFPFFFLIFFLVISNVNGITLVNVTTSRGVVIGSHMNQGTNTSAYYYGEADTFYGIPFAIPPVGPLRFTKPQRLAKFQQNPYNATWGRYPECIQGHNVTSSMSEDCLYLSIWSPNVSTTTKYPVMVWIHGGGLMGGSGQLYTQGIVRNLVSKGVVIVSIQYRLGFLGFFTTFTDDFPPNLGMLDQVEALKFVQEEISNFGGDPNRVTIFGQSAGGASIALHTYSPLSQNLFHQSIQESGASLTCFEDSLGPTYRMIEFARRTCNYDAVQWNSLNYTSLKNCLMNLDLTAGLHAQQASSLSNTLCWDIVQDDYFFPGLPRTLYQNRPVKPAMIGTMKDEYAWIVIDFSLNANFTQLTSYTKNFTKKALGNLFNSFLTNHTEEVFQILINNYFDPMVADDDNMAWLQFYVDIGTSFFFTSFAGRDITDHLLQNNSNMYVFEFTYPSQIDGGYNNVVPDWHPVPHMAEIPYLFYEVNWEKELKAGKINQTDFDLTNFFGEAWTNFAKFGKPTMDNSWKPTTSSDPKMMEYFEIGANSGMRTGYRKHDQITFNQLLPPILGETPPYLPDYNNGSLIGCPAGWTKSTVNSHKCYNIFTDISNFEHNLGECQFHLGEMASIDNAFENNEIQSYIKQNAPSCNVTYIGLIDNGGVWTWQNGDKSTYINWETGNPTTNSFYNCTLFNSSDGKWLNQDCLSHRCFLCGYAI